MFHNIEHYRVLDNNFHHGLKPFTNELTVWDKEKGEPYRIITNSLGFADSEPRKVPLKKEKKRILFMGDSFIEGVGYPWEETVAGIISPKLAKEGIELLNGSVASYSPKIYWLKTKYFIDRGLEIDELYVFIDISDIIDEVVYDYFVPQTFSKIREKLEPVVHFFSKNSYSFRSYQLATAIYQENPYNEHGPFWGGLRNFYHLKPQWTFNEESLEIYGNKGIELAKKHMIEIEKLCKEKGIKLTIVVWPWHVNLIGKHGRKNLHLWEEFATEREIGFIQLYDLFEQVPSESINDYFIFQDIHWSKKGNLFVADYLWAEMKKNLKIP
ncbi:MAG: hypothetical protein ACOX2F_08190 [bacterium]